MNKVENESVRLIEMCGIRSYCSVIIAYIIQSIWYMYTAYIRRILFLKRRDGRVAEGTTLLTWHGVKLIEGSNPSLSAPIKNKIPIKGFYFLLALEVGEGFESRTFSSADEKGGGVATACRPKRSEAREL